jgi:predicted glycogen debranching enzyme
MMEPVLRVVHPPSEYPKTDDLTGEKDPTSPLVTREWLVTNGLGGYASGTVGGIATRRFHGLLVSALPSPLGRTMMLSLVRETVRLADGRAIVLSPTGPIVSGDPAAATLQEFRLEWGMPVWTFDVAGAIVERRIWMPHQQNTVHVAYRVLSGAGAVLEIEPWMRFRSHDGALDLPMEDAYALTVIEDRYEVQADALPPLRLSVEGDGSFSIDRKRLRDVRYQAERIRGYDSTGELYSPGYFRVPLKPGAAVALVASTDDWESIRALRSEAAHAAERERRRRLIATASPAARDGMGAHLVLAADQFVITPAGRLEDAARAHATGDEIRTVIAGYHWFTDWGRDTMISLEGLTLCTGRFAEAGYLLRTFAGYVRDGLIPNLFPERGKNGLYHTADATLWFVHALDRYVDATGDRDTLRLLLPVLVDIVDKHVAGTRFGIGVDARDGLLTQGQEGYALTWMDAKVGDLVVTPRRGKAVEINALWYNALRLLARWLEEERGPDTARPYAQLAERAFDSFNRRFWFEAGGYLYDRVDTPEGGDDPAFRPNQIFAVSLPNPVLDRSRWPAVVEQVRTRLLTPIGLRSLDASNPAYKPKYFGDLRARDLAYHQGTVWAWLIGPFIDATLKTGQDASSARALLEGFAPHLLEAGMGSISEIFDAEAPFVPRGCIAQAWSVAEALRCWIKTVG